MTRTALAFDENWLEPDELARLRRRLPMAYINAVPVLLDEHGVPEKVGLLLRTGDDGSLVREVIGGRVRFHETLRAALMRHAEKDLGPLAMPMVPPSTVPFAVTEYFPHPSETGFTDNRQHAVALNYVVPVRGECQPREDALQLSWVTPEEALSADIQAEFAGGRGRLIEQALAHVGWGR